MPPHHRRRFENGTLVVGELLQSGPHHVGDRLRNPRRGQQLFDQERDAVRYPHDPRTDIGVGIGATGGDDLRHLTLGKAVEVQIRDTGPSPLPADQIRGR